MRIDSLDLTNDIIEILYNPFLKYRPFLLRLINFNNEKHELRLSKDQLIEIHNFIGEYLKTDFDQEETIGK